MTMSSSDAVRKQWCCTKNRTCGRGTHYSGFRCQTWWINKVSLILKHGTRETTETDLEMQHGTAAEQILQDPATQAAVE